MTDEIRFEQSEHLGSITSSAPLPPDYVSKKPTKRSQCTVCEGQGTYVVSDTGEYEDGHPLHPIDLDCQACVPDEKYEKVIQEWEKNWGEKARTVREAAVVATVEMEEAEERDLSVVMYTEGLPFDGNTINECSLGGSETAAYYMCRELARCGNQVRLFCNTENPGLYEGVEYVEVGDFVKMLEDGMKADVLICSRHLQHLLHAKTAEAFKVHVVWNHDIVLPQLAELYKATLWSMDSLFFNSEFHRRQCASVVGGLPERSCYITRNGVDLDLVATATEGVERDPNKLIYTSRPDRGLDVLLAMWPRLKKKLPDAKLCIAYYEFKEADEGPLKEIVQQLEKRIAELPDVIRLPAMKKEDLYREIASAWLLIYPTIFWETSCISALEAMACGTPVITSDYCALKETVPHQHAGLLIKGWPRRDRDGGGYNYAEPRTSYQRDFVNAVASVVESPALWEKLHEGSLRWVRQYHYPEIGREWDVKLKELVATQDHRQTVTACLIVRDGEGTLHRCLKSIKDEVDHICIMLDDRTEDSTEEIARKYTDDVMPYTFTNFGEARNLSIQRVKTDWILWIDADEVLQGGIKRYLRDNCFNAYSIPQVHLAPGIPEHRDLPARLFRTGMGIKFYGEIHEQPEKILNQGIPKTLLLPDVVIAHDGYGGVGTIDKRWERNHEHMKHDLEENPNRLISWFSYMRDCVSGTERMLKKSGNVLTPELDELLDQAIQIYLDHFSSSEHHWHPLAYPLYQKALKMKGFPEFGICLAASRDPIPQGYQFKVQRRLFRDREEFRDFLLASAEKVFKTLFPEHSCPFEDSIEGGMDEP